jgi:hypothetical protein
MRGIVISNEICEEGKIFLEALCLVEIFYLSLTAGTGSEP